MRRDEIVKALRCFASEENCPVNECNEKCPYWMENDKFDIDNPNAEISDGHQLCRAAADMLEQNDHLADTGKTVPLTLDELDSLNAGVLGGVPIWIEHRSDKPDLLRWRFSGWQVLRGMEQDHMLLNNDAELDLWNLNKVWRCWKRQPTQEETANAPWEGASTK